MLDVKALGQQMMVEVRGFVVRAIAPLKERIDEIEKRVPDLTTLASKADLSAACRAAFADIPMPKDGKSVNIQELKLLVDAAVAAVPKPKEGEPGKDADVDTVAAKVLDKVMSALEQIPPPKNGKDADPEAMRAAVREEVQRAVSGLPPAKSGKDADPEVIRSEVQRAVAAIPKPKNGEDGTSVTIEDVKPLILSLVEAVPKPKDGKSITLEEVSGFLAAQVARAELDFERRATDVLQRAVDRIPQPKPGKDGANGFKLENFSAASKDSGRILILKFKDEEREQTFELRTDVVLDRGTYKAGQSYERGDGVTYGGSYWIAVKDTDLAPANGDGWRLAVKRGQDRERPRMNLGYPFLELARWHPAGITDAKVIAPADGHLLTLEQCRAQCEVVPIDNVDSDGNGTHPDDDLILGYLDAAVEMAEDFTGLSLSLKTFEFAFDRFPVTYSSGRRSSYIEVPVSPFVDVVQFLVGESSDADLLIEGTDYTIDTYGQFAKLRAVASWPTTPGSPNFVTVQVRAGYPLDSDGVVVGLPNTIKQAILLTVGDWYAHREDSGDKQLYALPNGAQNLLRAKRIRLGMA